jgi:hypothetical protein
VAVNAQGISDVPRHHNLLVTRDVGLNFVGSFRQENSATPGTCHGFYNPRSLVFVVRKHELFVVGWEKERLWHDVKVLETPKMLHALDVLVQTIFSGEFTGSARTPRKTQLDSQKMPKIFQNFLTLEND